MSSGDHSHSRHGNSLRHATAHRDAERETTRTPHAHRPSGDSYWRCLGSTGSGQWRSLLSSAIGTPAVVIFAWPGIGRLLYEGIFQRDFLLVQGVVMEAGDRARPQWADRPRGSIGGHRSSSPKLKVARPSMLGIGLPDRHALSRSTSSKRADRDACSLRASGFVVCRACSIAVGPITASS